MSSSTPAEPTYRLALATPPLPAPARADLTVVPSARVTRYLAGTIPTEGRPDRWISGAVYDAELALVPGSQRRRGVTRDRVAACDLERIPEPQGAASLPGTWVYGGHFMHPFGHFLTETLTTLWPEREAHGEVAGIVAHRWTTHHLEPATWHRDLLEASGWGGLPVRIVGARPLRVERLLVPDRAFVVGSFVHPEAVGTWRRVGRRLARGDSPRRVYLSRTRFNADLAAEGREPRSSPQRDAALERDFAAAGFEVVHPETLSVADQVALVAEARVIAGAAGSALHLSAFATRPALVVEVGDARSPDHRLIGQRMIDRACGHPGALVRADQSAAAVLDGLDLDVVPPSR